MKSALTRSNINVESISKIVHKGITFDLILPKRVGFPFPVKVHQLETRHTNKRKLYTAQRAAVWSSILRKLTILIGPPGTGKTDTLLEIINTGIQLLSKIATYVGSVA